ncbi:hypothetical protein DSM104299_04146 [Baekduia alba]|uniref:hypothetical protein n=1 Tax=Baekduia alba TaxID=2997333 RepID=UPI0023407D53|nr:hypothetical protein [Baekduia alba]WCB95403.1 hypothetical protein DSM104299_04146 [Baekduia alba]
MMQLTALPLGERPVAELPEETLDWELLPADVFGPREEPRALPTGPRERVPLGMSRIAASRELGRGWEGAYIAHGVRAEGLGGDWTDALTCPPEEIEQRRLYLLDIRTRRRSAPAD